MQGWWDGMDGGTRTEEGDFNDVEENGVRFAFPGQSDQ